MLIGQNFDYTQWLVRLCIILVCAGLGIALIAIGRKKAMTLAIAQVALSIIVPVLVGCYIHIRKDDGMATYSDIEQMAEELRMFRYGNMAPLIIAGLYTTLIVSTTLTVQKIIALRKVS